MFRILVATACVAVLSFVGYFFWGEYSKHRAAAERAEGIERARSEIFEFAKAKPHETQKVRDWCKMTNERLKTDLADNELARGVVRNCRYFDYL